MASLAPSPPRADSPLAWFWEFIKQELTPYPGRTAIVARMVISTALIMIIAMTFRLSSAYLGAYLALLLSRDSPRATLQSAAVVFLAAAAAAAYLLVTIRFVIDLPPLHFLWVIGTVFLGFYLIRTLTITIAANIFAFVIGGGITLWDRHVSAETNVEDTLRVLLSVLVGVAVTAGVEFVFVRLRPGDEVLLLIARRLSAVENLLNCYAENRAPDPNSAQTVLGLEMLGTSTLRRILGRTDRSRQYSAAMAGVAVLVGRVVDLAAALTHLSFEPSVADQNRLRSLASTLATIRNDLMNRRIPGPVRLDVDEASAGAVPLLAEMEHTVAHIPRAFAASESADQYLPLSEARPRPALFAPDALDNPEHLRFALKGCLAASGSYVIYNAITWPGISTAIITCMITALSTIGASHQKQILRLSGAIIGGFVIGMGSQIFILPYLDSISGFTVLFTIVTGLASWVLTASPRLSYFGGQLGLVFYLINLQEFTFQTSLSVARDRVVGVLLGLSMMWLVFDQLWAARAGVEMKRTFISNLRLLAQFAREPLSSDLKIAIQRILSLRETINANLDTVRALADGVLFEFGPSRRQDLALRDQIRRWQPPLRIYYLMRIALIRYRLQLPGFELPDNFRQFQQEYDNRSAGLFENLAARIEGEAPPLEHMPHDLVGRLEQLVREYYAGEAAPVLTPHVESFVTLLHETDDLISSLAEEITSAAT